MILDSYHKGDQVDMEEVLRLDKNEDIGILLIMKIRKGSPYSEKKKSENSENLSYEYIVFLIQTVLMWVKYGIKNAGFSTVRIEIK